MLPLRGKIHRLRRPEILLAKNLFPSLAPPAPAEGDKEPGHLRTRHSEVEPDRSGSGGGGGLLACLDGHLGDQLHDDEEED